MQVRPATPEHVPECLEMARAFVEKSAYGQFFTYDERSTEDFLFHLIMNDSAILLYTPGGMLGAILASPPFNTDELMATELFLWSDGGGKAAHLIEAFECWAQGRGAKLACLSSLDRPGQSDPSKLYASRGYVRAETSYQKGL